jgi:hypothetical protein
MPLNTLGELLGATEELRALQARVRRLRELQTLYFRAAPVELAGSSRVKGCRAGTLFVCADNAAVAAKLKQLVPRLLTSIRQIESEITQIRIQVQVRSTRGETAYSSRKAPLTAQIAGKFGDLAARVANPGLKSALERLARRHRAGAAALDQNEPLEHEEDHEDDHHDEHELKRAPRPSEITAVAGVEKKREGDDDHE